jgi:DHA1 family multidrug resistance protein-like MFS transporter
MKVNGVYQPSLQSALKKRSQRLLAFCTKFQTRAQAVSQQTENRMTLEHSASTISKREAFRLSAYLQISGLISLSVWMLLLLPDFLAQEGWSSQKIGWAMGSYFSVYLLVQILAGQIAGRYGNITTALIGAGLGICGSVNYLTALKWPNLIFLARTLHGAGAAMVTAGALFHLVDSVPSYLRGRMIGYFGLPGFVMLAAGPLLAEFFQGLMGIGGTFSAILAIFAAMFWIVRKLPESLQRQDLPAEPFARAVKQNFFKLRRILFFSFFFGFCFSVWQSFMAPAVSTVGTGAVSAFGLGYGMGAVLTRLGISQRLETGPSRLAAIASLVAYGVCLSFIPQASHVWHLGVLGLISGMSHGVYYPALSSIAAERFHTSGTGSAMSLYISSSSLGMFVGPPVWGTLADRTGYGWIFVAAGGTVATATLVFLFLEARTQ